MKIFVDQIHFSERFCEAIISYFNRKERLDCTVAHCPFFVGMPSLCYYSGGLDSTFLQDMRIKQSFSGFHSSDIKNYAQVNISMENLSFAEDHNSSFPILLKKFFGISS